jgi:signal transduction histidine kinase
MTLGMGGPLSGDELHALAEEHAASRRVATLVARGVPPEEVFAAVTEEVSQLLSVEYAGLSRYEPDGSATIVAGSGSRGERVPVGRRWTLGGNNITTLVFETGRPARIDGYSDASGSLGDAAREERVGSGAGAPVIVEGRVWGVMAVYSALEQSLAVDTEARLGNFTELLATAIANAESRAELARLAEEQAALRRVATLVARGALPEEVFAAVTAEIGQLLPVDSAAMGCYEPDGTLVFVASCGRAANIVPVGSQWSTDGKNVGAAVFKTGRPVRMDDYADASGRAGVNARDNGIRSSVGSPIVVEGRLWGLVGAASSEQPLPADTEARLASFTELVATAIANAEGRAALARLADEQAALRRVATLVARGALPEEVFAAVTEEIGQLLPVDSASMGRYESDGKVVFVASWGRAVNFVPVGSRWNANRKNVGALVFETGRSVRIDDYADASGLVGVNAREHGLHSAVGTPIVVEGRLWGVMGAGSTFEQPLPADTEARLADFTELLATAIANAEGRAALAASRARVVAAADEARRRIERDLHDGTQQRLVSLGLELRTARAALPPELGELERKLAHVNEELTSVFEELREISHGIHPAILSRGGLGPALRALGRRSAVAVELVVDAGSRLPEPIEVAAYYVVSEALTNTAKHAHASVVHVELEARDSTVRLAVRDDGVGGADLRQGFGLVGLRDRIEALGGALQVTSPVGNGTELLIEIPLDDKSA